MKTPLHSITVLFVVLSFSGICRNAAALNEASPLVPDFVTQFGSLTHHPEALGFRTGAGAPILGTNIADEDSRKSHYQGICRREGSGTPHFYLSSSGIGDSRRAHLLTVRMGSRGTDGERLRSNRLVKGSNTNETPPPPDDGVIHDHMLDYHHAGGMQTCGDILAVPLEDPEMSGLPTGRVDFYDLTNPAVPVRMNYSLGLSTDAGVCGLAKLPDNRFLLAVTWGDNESISFFRSNESSFLSPRFAFYPHGSWVASELTGGTWPTGSDVATAYQSLSLLVQTDGRVFMLGARNTAVTTPLLDGSDLLCGYEISGWQAGARIAIRQVAPPKHRYCSTPGSVSDPVREATAGTNADFLAGVSAFLSPSGELIVYACEHWNDGPGNCIRGVEFRNLNMVRSGSPLYGRHPQLSTPEVMDEGGQATLDASGSVNRWVQPWIMLYDDDNFGGQTVVMDWADSQSDDYQDLRELDAFNDKLSSLRWWAPPGWTIKLYDQDNFGTDEPTLELSCDGTIKGISNLSDPPWEFDNGDLVNVNETRVTSVRFIPPANHDVGAPPSCAWRILNAPIGYSLSSTTAINPTLNAGGGNENVTVELTLGPAPFVVLTRQIFVRNRPPAFGLINTSVNHQRLELEVNFTDPWPRDGHTVRFEWGDGSPPETVPLAGGGATRIMRVHQYTEPQPALQAVSSLFKVKVDLSDEASGVDQGLDVPVIWRVIGPGTDIDSDGLMDEWEAARFGGLYATGAGDHDFDGRTNLDEYIEGTNPGDCEDFFNLTVQPWGVDRLKIEFYGRRLAGPGYPAGKKRIYRLLKNDSLDPGNWLPDLTIGTGGVGGTDRWEFFYPRTQGNQRDFYRMAVSTE